MLGEIHLIFVHIQKACRWSIGPLVKHGLTLLFLTCLSGLKCQDSDQPSIDGIRLDHSKYSDEEINATYRIEASKYFSEPENAKQVYQSLLTDAAEWKRPFLIAEGHLSLAMMSEMVGNYDEAIPGYMAALKINSSAHNHRQKILISNGLGNLYSLKGEETKAEDYLDSARILVLEIQDSILYTEVYLKIGSHHRRFGRYHSAVVSLNQALDYSHHVPSALARINILEILYLCHRDIGDLVSAEKSVSDAILACEEQGYQSTKHKFLLYQVELLNQQGLTQESIGLLKQILAYQESKSKTLKIFQCHGLLAKAYVRSDSTQQAHLHLEQAQALLSEKLSPRLKRTYLQAAHELAKHEQQWSAAQEYLDELITINGDIDDRKALISNYDGLAELNAHKVSWKSAYLSLTKANELRSDLQISEQNKLIADLDKKYQLKSKTDRIESLEESSALQAKIISNNKRFFLLLSLAMLGLLGAFLFVYRLLRQRSENLKEIAKKNAELEKAIGQNKMLIKEMHHRVKNNLQVVSSLLNLQGYFEKDEGVLSAINAGKMRIQSMSLLHQSLYSNTDLNHVNVKEYMTDLIQAIVTDYPLENELEIELNIEDVQLDVDSIVPLGLVTNELITNAMKYAFKDHNQPKLSCSLEQEDQLIRLVVKDNGPGFPFRSLPKQSDSLGMQLIRTFGNQLNAKVEIDSFKGAEMRLTFIKPKPTKDSFALRGIAS